ncbi:MAG: tRNA-dihydrouridine synthase family protein [Lentisphaeria bacterium]
MPPATHPFLQPLPLAGGRLSLPDRLPPGPMEGITAGAFVRVLTTRGLARSWITPFLRISTAVPRPARLRERLAEFLDAATAFQLPSVVQLMGTDIPLLAAAAAEIVRLPGIVGIDLNCACPSPTVVRNGAGGARLAEPRWIHDALLALRRACPEHGVSVKLRSGLRSPHELPALLAAVRSAQPDFVMLHWRTVAEGYHAAPDAGDRLKRARQLLPGIPLLASGNVFTPAAALALHRETGVDGVTPARGLLRNPWLLAEIRAAAAGQPAAERGAAEKAAFLLSLAQTAAAGPERWRRGFLLELARHLFGLGSPRFQALAAAADAESFQAALRAEAGP